MSRLNDANLQIAREILSRYPVARSATIPLLHLSQQQNGYVTNDAIAHVAELVGATSAEVLGTCTFYEMFKMEPVGKYLVNICGTLSCALMGAHDLMHRAEASGYDTLILTVDTAVGGIRRREVRNGLTIPPQLRLGTMAEMALHPGTKAGASVYLGLAFILIGVAISLASIRQYRRSIADLKPVVALALEVVADHQLVVLEVLE